MKNSCKRFSNYRLVFTAFIFLGIVNTHAQPAKYKPIIKYAINNYAAIAKAACDTCKPVIGKPLKVGRPIPFPLTAAVNFAPGVDIDQIPGIAAPNFLGGGSPEIKGLVKKVAGMTDQYASSLRKTDLLYFASGARDIAVSKSGKIYTSSLSRAPGPIIKDEDGDIVMYNGIFSFKSNPELLPLFNSTSEQAVEKSPEKFRFRDSVYTNYHKDIQYFAIDPENENIVYASLRNAQLKSAKILVRKNPGDGTWERLDWDIPGGLGDPVWGALAVDHDGNLYIADSTHHVIVKATFDDGGKPKSWQIIGGKFNTPGLVNDEDGEDARFNKPSGICVDKDGNVYVGDAGNNVVRRIDTDGEVTIYAGDEEGKAGFRDDQSWYGARFNRPTALAYNEMTESLFVIDYNNKTIREIDDDREVSTLAGLAGSFNPITNPGGFAMNVYYYLALLNMDPDEAKFSDLTGIAVDPSGLGLYVSDGKYIKYVNTFEASFTVTSSIREPGAKEDLHGLPILPPGVFINPNNGAFFGVPLMEWEPTTYTIEGTNHLGPSTFLTNGFITFEVVKCPDIVDTSVENITISMKQLPYTWQGRTFIGAAKSYLNLKNVIGCDSVAMLNLVILPEISYANQPYIFTLNQQVKPLLPTVIGSKIIAFSVAPPLPKGLALSTTTGEISGTPTEQNVIQPGPVIGPQTLVPYEAPWPLSTMGGADITQVKILDVNKTAILENNTAFSSLTGTVGNGTGTPGAYTDFGALTPIKVSTANPYTVQLSNALSSGSRYSYSLNDIYGAYMYKNSYAVYIDYNRDGDFADAGERVYISADPQRDAHTEAFELNISPSAKAGVTKMRIYCVEARTSPATYFMTTIQSGSLSPLLRTTSQALSFYPFYYKISANGPMDFSTYSINYGEFEDYALDIQTPNTQAYLVIGTNAIGTAQTTIKLAVNKPSTSTNNITICSTELPYRWNGLTFTQAGSQVAHLTNMYGADSAATLNLTVKMATASIKEVAYCGDYTYNGVVYTNSGDYTVHFTNAVGCDSAVIFRFRQKANSSVTNLTISPAQLPFAWNNLSFATAGSKTAKLVNAENCDSNATLNLRVLYNITYPASNLLEVNKTITPLKPVIEGNYSPTGVWYNSYWGYSISPALPLGLVLDPVTGYITGTPTQLSPLTTYTITLNQDGAQPSTIILSVGVPSITTTNIDNCGPYSFNGTVYDRPTTMSGLFKNQYGFDSTSTIVLTIRNLSAATTHLFAKQSELPLTWNDINLNKEGSRTIYLVNAVGCDSAVTVNLVLVPDVLYTSPNILQPGQAIAPIVPQQSGGTIPAEEKMVTTLIKANYLSPVSVALDGDSNTYVSDDKHAIIYKINRKGIVSIVEGFTNVSASLATDKAGNLYVADRTSNRIMKKDVAGVVTVLANASIPTGIAVDASGNIYFSESRYHRIQKISTAGILSTLAGGTTSGYTDGSGTTAKFNVPSGLSTDAAGNVYVADRLNNRIRKITPAGEVTSYAGNGTAASLNGALSTAGFNTPVDIAIDHFDNKYVVDNGSSRIRMIDTAGMVSTLAGTSNGYRDGAGAQAQFNNPSSLTTTAHGQVYVADQANAAIRQINAVNYVIHPALAKGLQFNTATGVISGTPAEILPKAITHTIYASNNAGTDTVQTIIGVCNPVATSFTIDTCDQYVWNDSTYTISTTGIRTLKSDGGCDSVVTMHLIIRKGSVGANTTIDACVSYVWEGTTYTESGVYTKVYPNAVGCDSTLMLNLAIKSISTYNLYVEIGASQFPYKWRTKEFDEPGTQSEAYTNSVGCDSIVSMTVSLSKVLPIITYASKDTTLYWNKTLDAPIELTNTGTPVPAMKIGERDTLANFSAQANAPFGRGVMIDHIVKGPDGLHYATVVGRNQIFRLSKTGVWSVFAGSVDPGFNDGTTETAKFARPRGLAFDALGNLYVACAYYGTIRKITPEGQVIAINYDPRITFPLPYNVNAYFYDVNALAMDADNNLIVQSQQTITKMNMTTNQYVQTKMDHSPYFGTGELDMKVDSKGNIYILPVVATNVLKIKPNGDKVSIGKAGYSGSSFTPGNGPDAIIPAWINSMAIDPINDNLYLQANGTILRVDTSENVKAVGGTRWIAQNDQMVSVDTGKVAVIDNFKGGVLFTANVYGYGSLPFMDNYGTTNVINNEPKADFKNLDQRLRIDSSGSVAGIPRGSFQNHQTTYSVIAANQYGVGSTPLTIRNKSVVIVQETKVATAFPYVWKDQVFYAPTNTATYFVRNETLANDSMYKLHLVYEVPTPDITATGGCAGGDVTLTANSAAKGSARFDGSNIAKINSFENTGIFGYFTTEWTKVPNQFDRANFVYAMELWIKPETVNGIQYILTRDTTKQYGTLYGISIQNGKLVYEATKGLQQPYTDYKVVSDHDIVAGSWTHVAVAYYDSIMHLFINGQLEKTRQTNENTIGLGHRDPVTNEYFYADFFLGGLGTQYRFKGEMDELRIWQQRKNAQQIQATMNRTVDPLDPLLSLYYRFDEQEGNTLMDISKSNRTARFQKSPEWVPSKAPLKFATYSWMPGGAITSSVNVPPGTNTQYTLTVTDYKNTSGSATITPANKSTSSTENVRVCAIEYTWHGTTYSSSTNTATWTGVNQYGCDSVVTLNLTLDAPPTPLITGATQICAGSATTLTASGGDNFVWLPNGETTPSITVQPTTTTTYNLRVKGNNGCETTVSKTVVVSNASASIEIIIACDSYTWHGTKYTNSTNTATWVGMNAAGCDSVVTLNLTINPLPVPAIVSANGISVCEGEAILITARASGRQLDLDGNSRLVADAMGVDPATGFTLEAWVKPASMGGMQSIISQTRGNAPLPFDAFINANGTVSFAVGNGIATSSVTTAGALTTQKWSHLAFVYNNKSMAIYKDGVSVASGTAVVPVAGKLNNFMIGNNESLSRPLTGAIDEIRVWNKVLTPAQVLATLDKSVKHDAVGLLAYYKLDEADDELPLNTANGLRTASVIGGATHSASTAAIIYQSYNWGAGLTAPVITATDATALYNVNVVDVEGCTAAGSGKAGIGVPNAFTEVVKACGPYNWHGTTYNSSNNTAKWTSKNVSGCDSVVTLNLSIGAPTASTVNATACNYFVWNGNSYNQTTTATWIGENASGCDSVVTLHLTINKAVERTEIITACEPISWHGTTYAASTTAPVWYGKAKNDCDSIVHLNLTIADLPFAKINMLNRENVCEGYGVVLHNTTAPFTAFATGVRSFSSEIAVNRNQQILGQPNTYPNYGDYVTSWSTNTDMARREFIELTFDNAKPINFIEIYETFNSGTIDTVYVKNPATNQYEMVYSGTAELYSEPLQNRITFPLTTFGVSTVRIAMNSIDFPAQKALDAVSIGHASNTTFKWSDGSNSATLAATTPGKYYLAATSEFGCIAKDSISITTAELELSITNPEITAPANISRTNSAAICGAVIPDEELGSAIAKDLCPGVTVSTTGIPAGNLFPVGVTVITHTAINAAGRSTSVTQTVTVTDNAKPAFTINLSASQITIWPPDHSLKNIALSYITADNCGTVTNKVTVTSTDPITGVSDGDKSPDWIVTNDHMVQLRAERGNGKAARVYTITVTPVDAAGNMGTPQSVNVTIAHNITAPITGASFKIGSTVDFSGVFWDKQGNKHTGEWVIDDNTIVKGIITEPSGTKNGKLTGAYKFTTAGTYKLRMNITDQNKATSYCNTNEDMEAIVVIYDPNGGYTYGGGWFASPAGALKSDAAATGKANFGYALNYFKGAANPKGETQFELKVGDLEYNALNFEYLSIGGARAQIKGTGKITGGQSGINFIMTLIDGALDGTGIDKIRIKIYNRNTGLVYYDNEQGSDANNPVTKVGTNSQVVIGGTSVNTSSSAAILTKTPTPATPTVEAGKLQVQAFPNPSRSHFTLIVKGKIDEPVRIRVSDILGRLVEERKGLSANGTFTIGASYHAGLYMAEILQGKEKIVFKLLKQ
ncbi:MAG: LamG-like jellyroll fold domain-containing protein [Bacteroidota bacterium]